MLYKTPYFIVLDSSVKTLEVKAIEFHRIAATKIMSTHKKNGRINANYLIFKTQLPQLKAGPDGSFVSTRACNLEVPGSNPGRADISHRGCAYTVLQTVQRHGVCSAVYGTVHYKEPLKSFEIRVEHSPGFKLPSVAILP